MEKKKYKHNSWITTIAIVLTMLFCSCFFVGCFSLGGYTGGSSGGGSSSGGDKEEEEEWENPYAGSAAKYIEDYNSVFMGAIAVYEMEDRNEAIYIVRTLLFEFCSFNFVSLTIA